MSKGNNIQSPLKKTYHNFFKDSSLVYYCTVNLEAKYTFVNDLFKETYYRHGDLEGKSVFTTCDSRDHENMNIAVGKAIANPGKPVIVHIRKLLETYSQWTRWEFIAIPDLSGGIEEIACIGIDEREFTKQKEKQKILKQAMELSGPILIQLNKKGEIEDASTGFQRFFSKKDDSFLGEAFFSEYTDKALLNIDLKGKLGGLISNNTSISFDFGWRTPKGMRWIDMSLEPFFDEAQNFKGFIVLGVEITEKVKKNEELKRNYALLEGAETLAKVGSFVYIIKNDKVILSEGAQKLLGFDESKRQVDFDQLYSLVDVEDQLKFTEIKRELKLMRAKKDAFRIKDRNGNIVYLNIASVPFKSDRFPAKKAQLVVIHDVTIEQNQINKILNQNEKLQHIAWFQSHKVRSPLANIMGLVALLQTNLDESEFAKILLMLNDASKKLDEVVKSIVDGAQDD